MEQKKLPTVGRTNLFVKNWLQAEGTGLRVFLILCDLPTNYASGTTAFFAVVGIDHFWVGYESIHRVNLVGKTFQLSKPLSLVHSESFGGSLPFPLNILV